MTSWRKILLQTFDLTPGQLRAVYPENLDWDREFDSGYGGAEGTPFHAWTHNHVYFCACYDGVEWIDRVPRNPDNTTPEHVGNG